MTGVLLLLEKVASEVPAERRELLAEAQEATRRSVDEVRRIAQELRPELLEHLGLASALKALATSVTERAGLEFEKDFARKLPPLDPDVELAVYRVAQESLTNVARHAQASRVQIDLSLVRATGERLGMRGEVLVHLLIHRPHVLVPPQRGVRRLARRLREGVGNVARVGSECREFAERLERHGG